jgi:glutathione S-transferase
MTQPIQPLVEDERGIIRFQANAIVTHLLDRGGIDLNQIARENFSQEDREQFAQLIGFSWSGASDLGYMSAEVLDAAMAMKDAGPSEAEARAEALRAQLAKAKELLRDGVAELFNIHPDDLST